MQLPSCQRYETYLWYTCTQLYSEIRRRPHEEECGLTYNTALVQPRICTVPFNVGGYITGLVVFFSPSTYPPGQYTGHKYEHDSSPRNEELGPSWEGQPLFGHLRVVEG